MEVNSLIALIVVPTVFITIPLIWKLAKKYSNRDQWANWKNGVMSIDANDIYLAGAFNRRAKKNRHVTSENCDAYIHFNGDSIIYQENDELRYVIPLTAIESIVDGVDYYAVIRSNDKNPYHEIIINLKIESCIKVIDNNEEFVRKNKSGCNNTVEINDLYLVNSDHKLILDKLTKWIEK